VEVAINRVHQYCEGIRPPPGMKTVMKNELFRNLLVGLHSSDIAHHPHREVLILYYETSVRFYPILKQRPDLLQLVLQAMTGPRGLQHEDQKVRSRCCYLLLRLIKSLGSNNSNSASNVLRPYVETAIAGIQMFLENKATLLRSDDALNLFEAAGLLLGKTGLSTEVQQRYLAQVMTPHVGSIEIALTQHQQAIGEDNNLYGERLSNSIAAIAYLSKGFKVPPPEVQAIFLETSEIAMTVLETLPENFMIRNKILILAQRLIQCLEDKILPSIPRMLSLLINNSTAEDILDVSQLMNQLCMKFGANAIGSLDSSLLPFLQRCHNLSVMLTAESSEGTEGEADAPHLYTEQLSIQKLSYVVLQHVVVHRATAVLLSPTNVCCFEDILQTMCNGAISVEDSIIKKSCLVFFRELLDQWVVGVDGTYYREPPTVIPPDVVVHVLLKCFCVTLFPGMVQVFLNTASGSINVDDANNFRCLSEFCGILEIIKNRQPDIYRQETTKFAHQADFSQPVVDGFCSAITRKEFEGVFKSLILSNKSNDRNTSIAATCR
jgi:exportin-T